MGLIIGMLIGLVIGVLKDEKVNKQLEEKGYVIQAIEYNEENNKQKDLWMGKFKDIPYIYSERKFAG